MANPNIPLVSVIMPAYNAAATIAESISSVLAQTYQLWELIIVNDASTDNTWEIITNFAKEDSRVIIYTNRHNSGVAATRNVAMEKARGKYFAFLDSDDLWLPQKLDKQLRFMQEANAMISYTATSYINTAGQMSGHILRAERNLSYKQLLRMNLMSCSSVMVCCDVMRPFPSSIMHEDYAVWLHILKEVNQAHGLDEPLLVYRMGSNSKSANRINSAVMIYRTYRHISCGIIKSFFYTLRYAQHSITKRALIKFEAKEGSI